jgi:regulator of protease activity HflC (stomatin/prohibitin superfamily)
MGRPAPAIPTPLSAALYAAGGAALGGAIALAWSGASFQLVGVFALLTCAAAVGGLLAGDRNMYGNEIIIKDTHRGLWYEDGILKQVLAAGRYELPKGPEHGWFGRRLHPRVEVVLVDVRERELTIKGQEILTSDKVAIRVSIIVQFRVVDPRAALHEVENYEERLYSDVQLAARRSLASMSLEQILTNRNQLSEDILSEVKETAARYGVAIGRADVKDLIFPGNLQEIMNKVLAAERMSQAALVEARTKARQQQIDAEAKAEIQKLESQSYVAAQRASAEAAAESHRIRTDAEVRAAKEMEAAAAAYAANPSLLRLRELETLRELARNANARIYIGFDKHAKPDADLQTGTPPRL